VKKDIPYFEPVGFGADIFSQRYTAYEGEKWLEACRRVARHVATAESGSNRVKVEEEFFEQLAHNRFMPGGRIWYGSGKAKGQLLNCFVIPTHDSREGWGRTVSDSIVISGTGGGVGINCSPVRPRGHPVTGTGGTATGAVSLMEIVNAAGNVIKAGGGRRTALMLCLDVNHGDITEFLDKKLDLKELNNANVSVVFNEDPEDFFEKVRNGKPFDLLFKGRVVGTIPAAELWDRIITNALKGGEPGILNGYYANKMSNIHYYAKLVSTNPCGEIWMSPYDCCWLGAVVLPRFVQGVSPMIDWKMLKDSIFSSIRFLDNVLTVNNYPLPEIAGTCNNLRRIGLGIMGLHDTLLMMGLSYNSPESLEFVDKIMEFVKDNSYLASVELAKERGAFPVFDKDKFLKSAFVKTLKPTIRKAIAEFGMRNCATNTIAPTGTTAIVCGVTSGVEPMFAPAYERRWWVGDTRAMEVVVHPLLEKFVKDGKDVSHFQGTYDLSMRDHFEMQRICQRHTDNAVSKTINIKSDVSKEELSALYMEYLPELKGVTIYPDGSRENQPLTPLSLAEAIEFVGTASTGVDGKDSCKSGACDI